MNHEPTGVCSDEAYLLLEFFLNYTVYTFSLALSFYTRRRLAKDQRTNNKAITASGF